MRIRPANFEFPKGQRMTRPITPVIVGVYILEHFNMLSNMVFVVVNGILIFCPGMFFEQGKNNEE